MEPVPPLDPYAPPRAPTEPEASTGAMTEEEMRIFVGQADGYYLRKWEMANLTGSSYAGFNWEAALFTSLWMLYRRMYLEGAFVFGVQLALPELVTLAGRFLGLRLPNLLLLLIVPLALGFLGNALYLRRAREAVRVARLEPASWREVLGAQGGTSGKALFLGLLVWMVVSLLWGAIRAFFSYRR